MIIIFSLGTYYIHEPNEWVDGVFVSMAGKHGYVFKICMAISALATSFGVLTAELSSTSYLYNGLTVIGFGKRFENKKFNLIINFIILVSCVYVEIDTLIFLSTIMNAMTLNCEVYAWIKIKGLKYIRVVFSMWILCNNFFIMSCMDYDCILGMVISCGLALGIIGLSEFTISNTTNI